MRPLAVLLLVAAAAVAAEADERLPLHKQQRPPPPTAPNGNPFTALASALVGLVLYLLQLVQQVVAFVTITIPTLIVRMLHTSLTISLGFVHFAALFLAVASTIFFVVRYRYLTRYTKLKDTVLPVPSPPGFANSLPIVDSVLTDPSSGSSNPLHSYLDDFLSAIRIFGYLEKPVFHELSRHLQTRRLAAGDTMEIGGGEFWCVVEGRVQLFAPATDSAQPNSPDPFTSSRSKFNGYSLINEVSTGGTLSSLFSILSLFTEDIQLSWTPTTRNDSGDSEDSHDGPIRFGRLSRADSDVSQLGSKDLGMCLSPLEMSQPNPLTVDVADTSAATARGRSSSVGTAEGTTRQESWSPIPDRKVSTSTSQPATSSHSPAFGPMGLESPPTIVPPKNHAPTPPIGTPETHPHRRGSHLLDEAMKGTIARATTDSTLAVIPAEAFRKLTRKYPKATSSIVQVVLERFSRVTFMTAHKFLGLTREILRSEATLNELVSYPLPREFYTSGAMQVLRERFQVDGHREKVASRNSSKGDGFEYGSTSPTVRAPSVSSTSNTPAVRTRPLPNDELRRSSNQEESLAEELTTATPGRHQHSPSAKIQHTSAMRQQVAAGDLALSPTAPTGDTYYRAPVTPGFSRTATWRGSRFPTMSVADSDTDDDVEFELREALVSCIAKSIGLFQATEHETYPNSRLSVAASAVSTPNSPSLLANGRPVGRLGVGNVLDLMSPGVQHNSNVSGLLRESLMHGHMTETDDQSSISASVPDSYAGASDVNAKILRDLGTHIDVLYYPKGKVVVKEGEQAAGLYYVIDGFLDVSLFKEGRADDKVSVPVHGPDLEGKFTSLPSQSPHLSKKDNSRNFATSPTSMESAIHDEDEEDQLFTVKPGGLAGYLASLCNTESYVSITAKTDCFVGFIPQHALDMIVERRPIVLLTLAKRLLSLLSPQVLHIDAGLDWIQLSAGQVLYEKGDPSSDFYVLINGRLRSIERRQNSESVDILGEYGQGDSVGELDAITASPRSNTVQAIRETEIVRLPATLFDAISVRHPETTLQFMRVIANKVRSAVSTEHSVAHAVSNTSNELRPDRNLKTVCILGNTRSIPVAKFASKLKASLEDLGSTTSYLDLATVMRRLGRHAFTRIGALKIAGWLADQEQNHNTVLYVVDTPPSSQWTLTSIRQADLVLVLGMGDDPSLGEYEKLLLAMKCYARKELILLHGEHYVAPGYTRAWLKNRPWVQAHYHVELPGVITTVTSRKLHDPAAVAAFRHLREQVEEKINQYRGLRPLGRRRRPPHMDDFARIARRICGKQVGLVLGGGGARGISHIGMLQALEEAGIPVDAISGCSIGSMIGGLYSRNVDLLETTGRAKQFAGRMGSMLRILSDVTYPFVAYTTGHEFNRGVYKAFYNTQIEDMWIPFFCNSTNITHSRMEIHRSGYAWRYVRASMTLAGFLPPLSDNGVMLVDGGYMDNTPIGPLRGSGIRDIIVVDVGSIDDTSMRNYGDSVSGWWLFLNRFNPFYKAIVPSMTEISSRLTYVSSVKTLEDVKSDPDVRYMAMPVQHIETIGGFKKFSETREVGLKASRQQLKEWAAEGRLPRGLVDEKKKYPLLRRGSRARRSSI